MTNANATRTDAEICAKAIELIDAYKSLQAEWTMMRNDIRENGIESEYYVAEGAKWHEMAKAHERCDNFLWVDVFEYEVDFNQLSDATYSASADALKDMVREYLDC